MLPSLEVVYRTDPDALAAILPPPLSPPPEPRVHVRCTDIHLEFGDHVHQEKVGYFAVDAEYNGELGEYPLLIPIDLESAISISRERFGEPKKLAAIEMGRDGDHVFASITRNDVTFIEIVGDVAEELPVPEPYGPAVVVQVPAVGDRAADSTATHCSCVSIRSGARRRWSEWKGSSSCGTWRPTQSSICPIIETESIVWTVRTATTDPKIVGPVDAAAFEPFAYSRYDLAR